MLFNLFDVKEKGGVYVAVHAFYLNLDTEAASLNDEEKVVGDTLAQVLWDNMNVVMDTAIVYEKPKTLQMQNIWNSGKTKNCVVTDLKKIQYIAHKKSVKIFACLTWFRIM